MGKGDRKTTKGKRYNSSYGNARRHVVHVAALLVNKSPAAATVSVVSHSVASKAPAKKTASKTATTHKTVAKKATPRKPAVKKAATKTA